MKYKDDGIALIGVGCRFPKAHGPAQFWELLVNAVDAVTEPCEFRRALFQKTLGNIDDGLPLFGGYLDDIEHFDAQFFNISPREAVWMDPQQRVALEVAWEALDDAGLPYDELSGSKTGVFLGAVYSDYQQLVSSSASAIGPHAGTGSALSILANRISYCLNLSGPSIVVDTACSSSLAAVHLACHGLRSGECSLALAGGVNLMLLPLSTVYFYKAGLLARDGRCKSFSEDADGFVRGEGAAIVVLKRLEEAIESKDRIYAVIRGSALNHDGRTNGLMAPSRWAQIAVLNQAYEDAGISPQRVQYIEAHGTGTVLGDQIEAVALGQAVGKYRPAGATCALGSVKTNLGHLEAAAGVAGLVKVALMLQNKIKPASLHCSQPNTRIPFSDLGLHVQSRLEPFDRQGQSLVAGVSSFGFGGTNVHVVMEEAPEVDEERPQGKEFGKEQLLVFSARSQSSLMALVDAYRKFLGAQGEGKQAGLPDICGTAAVRRGHYEYRAAVWGKSGAEMSTRLREYRQQGMSTGLRVGQVAGGRHRIAFVCPGQGGQWAGMGKGLLDREPVFRQAVEECAEVMREELGWSVVERLERREVKGDLAEVQPVLFALEVGLAALWRWWGIDAEGVVGHSMGEVAAAYLAGRLSLGDAGKVICRRSRLLERLKGRGGMLAVGLGEEEAWKWLKGYEERVEIAASNSASATVWSGALGGLEELSRGLEQAGVFWRWVKVEVASHSRQVEELRMELLEALADLQHQHGGEVEMYSTVTGKALSGEELEGGYWMRNLREKVRFGETVEAMRKAGYDTLVELSPHPTLTAAMEETLERGGGGGLVVGSLRREQEDRAAMLEGLGALYVWGCAVDWKKAQRGRRPPVPLPPYPWQHERFWIEHPTRIGTPFAEIPAIGIEDAPRHPLLGQRLNIAGSAPVYLWQAALSRNDVPWIADHRVHGALVLPAAAFIEMALAAAHQIYGQASPIQVSDFGLHRTLIVPETRIIIQTSATVSGEHASFEVHSWDQETSAWILHGSAILTTIPATGPAPNTQSSTGWSDSICIADFYKKLAQAGLEYGDTFRALERLTAHEGKAIGQVNTTAFQRRTRYHAFPPALDCALQTVAALAEKIERIESAFLPVSIERIEFERNLPDQYTAIAEGGACDQGDGVIKTSIALADQDGLIATIRGLSLLRVNEAIIRGLRVSRKDASAISLLELRWREQQLPSRALRAPGTWLIFVEEDGLGPALALLVEQAGGRAIMVRRAAHFKKVNDREYHVRPCAEEDIRALLAETEPCGPACIVYCGGLAVETEEWDAGRLERFEVETSTTLVLLAKNLLDRGGKYRLWVATSGIQKVTDEREHRLAGSSLWGAGRVIANEHPEYWGGLADLDAAASPLEAARDLYQEILKGNGENQVAYRGGRRYVARFAKSSSNVPASGVRFDANGTYLVTGGSGALGMHLARWMAANGARKLLLISRHPPDPAEVNTIEAEVEFAPADVADEPAVRAILERYRSGSTHKIRGVIHAAGVLADGAIAGIKADSYALPFHSKVAGAWALHRYFRDIPLDFFVLFSSAASVFGSPGQAAYAAANAFMDALVQQRFRQGLPALSVNWGAWRGRGLAAASDRSEHLQALGLRMMEPESALASLAGLLHSSLTQATVVSLDWEQFRSLPFSQASVLSEISPAPALAAGASNGARSSISQEQLLAATEVDRRLIMEDLMKTELARVLRLSVSQVRLDVPLTRLGMDSLMAVSFRSAIERSIGILIPMQQLLKSESVNALVLYVLESIRCTSAAQDAAQDESAAEYEIARF